MHTQTHIQSSNCHPLLNVYTCSTGLQPCLQCSSGHQPHLAWPADDVKCLINAARLQQLPRHKVARKARHDWRSRENRIQGEPYACAVDAKP
jgi:hypothetical protein